MASKEYFDTIANQWDDMRQSFFSEAVREKAYAVAGVQPGKIAADLGAGTGFITEGLLPQGVKVIAVDQSAVMLAQMQQKFGAQANVEYRQGSAESLPIDDNALDYAFANMTLHHVDDPAKAIVEMSRILKPGGKLVITDLDEHQFDFLVTEQHDRWMGFKRPEVKSWFEAAGLKQVTTDCVGQNCCASSGKGEQAAISIFVAWGEK